MLPVGAWTVALSAVLPVAAAAADMTVPVPFRGNWAPNLAQCRDPDGMGIMSLGPNWVVFYEAQTIEGTLKILRSTSTEIVLTNRMRGEGRTWLNSFNLRLGADRQTLSWTGNGGYGSDKPEHYMRCPS